MPNMQEIMNCGIPAEPVKALFDKRTAGSTGSVTLNAPMGTVQVAAAAQSLTLTNSFISTSSLIFAKVMTNDATAKSANAVPGSGSATITLDAAATGTTVVAFWVIH